MAPCLLAFAQRCSEVGASLWSSYRDRARSSWDDVVAQHASWLWVEHGCVSELSRKPRHWRGPGCLSKIAAVGECTARDFEWPYRPVMCGFWFRCHARLHRAVVLKNVTTCSQSSKRAIDQGRCLCAGWCRRLGDHRSHSGDTASCAFPCQRSAQYWT